jgi:hypothetical protein
VRCDLEMETCRKSSLTWPEGSGLARTIERDLAWGESHRGRCREIVIKCQQLISVRTHKDGVGHG